jgi:hypothetical protein
MQRHELSDEQAWMLYAGAPDAVYHEVWVLSLRGPLDRNRLHAALAAVVLRHEALRMTFDMIEEQPCMRVADRIDVELPSTSAADETQARAAIERVASAPFEPGGAPWFRVALLELPHDEHWLVMVAHHAIFDEASRVIFFDELSRFYQAVPVIEPAAGFGEFLREQRQWLGSPAADVQVAFWKRHLAGAPALIELPTDRPRPPRPTFRGARQWIELNAAERDALQHCARTHGTTCFVVLLSALGIVLHRQSKHDDLVVGVPMSLRQSARWESTIGFMVNTVATRLDSSGKPTGSELMARVRGELLLAMQHSEVPFARVAHEMPGPRSAAFHPLFQVMLVAGEVARAPHFPGLAADFVEYALPVSKFDLCFVSLEPADGRMFIEYNTDLFAPPTVAALGQSLRMALHSLCTHPQGRIDS